MPTTQREQAINMVAQLRLVDPSISAEIGTPERKIIDVVAQALTDSQIDLTALQGALDIDSKFAGNLDRFVALFGFGRQAALYARGFAKFGRLLPATEDITIPANTRVMAVSGGRSVIFLTTYAAVLPAGEVEVPVPIRAVQAGVDGNVATNAIATIVGNPVFGITTVTNDTPTAGGKDAESDNQLKVRFKNTIFRNLAGTEDQYLALAVATPFSTKANVVGPISRYQEYIQVPEVDDATAYDINGDTQNESGNGIIGEYTSALSSIPFSKYHYDNVPVFVSNTSNGISNVFYRRDVDYRLNIESTAKNRGDTHRLALVSRGPSPITDSSTTYQPNVTFTNVYTGTFTDIQAIRPNDVVLLEHSYLSEASRNDIVRNITNAVDVYIDGGDVATGSVVLPNPTTANLFVDNPASKYHYDNYRRLGAREHRPIIGNLLMPLMHQPVLEVPELIDVQVGELTYIFERDVHYWAVEDHTIIGGTIRARGGIEWSMDKPAELLDSPDLFITDPSIDYITVDGYEYDRSIEALQAALESAKQVTTDVLAHRATRRYFKLDITVMYEPGASVAVTNNAIQLAVQEFVTSQYFGSVVQLSDLLQVIHGVSGVDNVRWTSDVPTSTDLARVYETNRFGRPLTNVQVEVRRAGRFTEGAVPGLTEIQQIIVAGLPTAGNYALKFASTYSNPIPYDADAAEVEAAFDFMTAGVDTVTGSGSASDPFVVTFTDEGPKSLIESTPVPTRLIPGVPLVNGFRDLYSPHYILDTDFFLKDDELISLALETDDTTLGATLDTVPGLIIRPRAQNTWVR